MICEPKVEQWMKADTLFRIYCDGKPENAMGNPIYWAGWQRVQDWIAAHAPTVERSLEVRKVSYYRDILQRIAGGWETPKTLAQLALDHEFHSKDCAYEKDQTEECNCGANDPPQPASEPTEEQEHSGI